MNNNIAVLVLSCDSYSDLWDPFFKLFFKYWSDCPYKIYLSSNFKEFNHERVTTLKAEVISDWSSELKIVLEKIRENHVILLLEDYFIYENVDRIALENIIDAYLKLNAVFFRLGTFPKIYKKLWLDKPLENYPGYVVFEKKSPYRLNLQVAIWNKKYLSDLVIAGESPWQFELEASKRSNTKSNLLLGLKPEQNKREIHGPITYYCGAVTKGNWMRRGLKIAKQNNIELDLSQRPVESYYRYYRRRIYTSLPIFVRIIIDKILSIFSIKNS